MVDWFVELHSLCTIRLFKLTAAVCGVLLLIFMQYLSSTDDHISAFRLSPLNNSASRNSTSRSSSLYKSASRKSRKSRKSASRSSSLNNSASRNSTSSRLSLLYNYSIWPRNGDDDDRVLSQIHFMNAYAQEKRKRKLKVLVRVGGHNFLDWADGQQQFVRGRCPIVDCTLTRDKSQARTADALLIVDFYHSRPQDYLPKPRQQVWIAVHREAPKYNHFNPRVLRGLVNWTLSYRHDSTIAVPYSKMVPNISATTTVTSGNESLNYAAGKTKLVAWFVSNCHAGNERLRYAGELSRYIQVDIYGSCGKFSCRRKSKMCLELLERDYKFYLSFENLNCDDYITEKFWRNALKHKLIPVVMGATKLNYKTRAPPHSFIHVEDFASPRQLASYLHLLANNDTLYNEYFRWRMTKWTDVDLRYWCRLCALLHWRDDVDYVHWYDDYYKWWNGACQRNNTPWFHHNKFRT